MTRHSGGESWPATFRRWAKIVAIVDAVAVGFAFAVVLAWRDFSPENIERVLWTCALIIGAGWLLAMMAAGAMRQASPLNHAGRMDDEELRYLIRPERFRDAVELTALALAICGSLVVAASLAGAL